MEESIDKTLRDYELWLRGKELSQGTIEKYRRDAMAFLCWLEEKEICKETAAEWKAHLREKMFAPTTINSMIVAVNVFFSFIGKEECRLKTLKIQRKMFRDSGTELTIHEYRKLINEAYSSKKYRLALLLETLGATGIRVSEVRYITVEAAKMCRADISLKGKIRTILLPSKLCGKLLQYAQKRNIASGEIFLTRSGNSLSRKQIWAEMKTLCEKAGVPREKVFPHNLRHLFAVAFYKESNDVVKLADVLGHASIETTRIYLLTTGTEHRKQIDRLGMVI